MTRKRSKALVDAQKRYYERNKNKKTYKEAQYRRILKSHVKQFIRSYATLTELKEIEQLAKQAEQKKKA